MEGHVLVALLLPDHFKPPDTNLAQKVWLSVSFYYIHHPYILFYSLVPAQVGSWIPFLWFFSSSLTCSEMFLLEADLLIWLLSFLKLVIL